MSTAVRSGVFEGEPTTAASQEASEPSWSRLALVSLIVGIALALGMASAASHPDVSAGDPEPPYIGWGD